MSTTIQDRAAIVLAEIEAALALADKATPGKWDTVDGEGDYFGETLIGLSETYEGWRDDVAFIAASRTLLPASLRMHKTAIEGFLLIAFFPHGGRDCSENGERAYASLAALINQWEEAQP